MSAAEAQAGFGRTLALDPAGLSAERLNRRFGACEVAAPIENNHVSEPAYKEVGAVCEYALALWPNANAAILFGSRARGDHRADSDWDVAFITQKDEFLPGSAGRVFDLLRKRSKIDVQALAISQARLCKSADSLGKIAEPIAREGRLIAGHCEWPEIESEPILKPVDYLGWRSGALRRVASASKNLALAIDLARKSNVQSELGDFVAATVSRYQNDTLDGRFRSRRIRFDGRKLRRGNRASDGKVSRQPACRIWESCLGGRSVRFFGQ